jgi:PAP2 superfamily
LAQFGNTDQLLKRNLQKRSCFIHAAYPMGHATQSFMLVYILESLLAKTDKDAALLASKPLRELAFRVSYNRIIAGVHFPIDQLAGMQLGAWLGRLFWELARPSPIWEEAVNSFDPAKAPNLTTAENNLAAVFNPGTRTKELKFSAQSGALQQIADAAINEWRWLKEPVYSKVKKVKK